MGLITRIFKRKRDPLRNLDENKLLNAIDLISDKINDIEFRKKQNLRRAKKYYESNKRPPVALLTNIRNEKYYIKILENKKETISAFMDILDMRNSMTNLAENKDLRDVNRALEQLNPLMQQNSNLLRNMIKDQSKFIQNQERHFQKMEMQFETIEEMGEQLASEVSQDLEIDILKDLAVDDPEFIETLPEELKREIK